MKIIRENVWSMFRYCNCVCFKFFKMFYILFFFSWLVGVRIYCEIIVGMGLFGGCWSGKLVLLLNDFYN